MRRIFAGWCVALFALTPFARAQLDENCTVTILNRSVQVGPGGSIAIPNVPVEPGLFRVRVYCSRNGETTGGQSGYITLVPNSTTVIGDIVMGELSPLPLSISILAPKTTFTLRAETAQFTASVALPDGTTADATQVDDGSFWSSSNPNIASVDPNGVVTARSRGMAIIQVRNEGVQAAVTVNVLIPEDADGDGMSDDFERLYGFNLSDAGDRLQDPDRDNLTNLDEFQRGTNPRLADTDGDGLTDGDEVARGTLPTRADSDGDGLSDGQEVIRGTNPMVADTDGDSISDGVELSLGLNPLVVDPVTTVQGRILDSTGSPAAGVTAILFGSLTALTDASGNFSRANVPAGQGDITATAQIIRAGKTEEGASTPVPPVPGGTTDVGTIQLATSVGLVTGTVLDPNQDPVPFARVEIVNGGLTRVVDADATGKYRFANMTVGSVLVKARDFRTSLRGFRNGVLQNDASLILDIVLSPLGTVTGIVSDTPAPGSPAIPVGAGVDVRFNGPGGAQSTKTDALGRYTFEFVPLGVYTVDASDTSGNRGRNSGNVSTTGRTFVSDITFLGKGTVVVTVLNAAAAGIDGAVVEFSSRSVFGGRSTKTAGPDGKVSFFDVFVGDFDLVARDPATRLAQYANGKIDGDGETVQVEAVLTAQTSAAGSLFGTVFRPDGVTVLPNADVVLSPTNLRTTTDANGDYLFPIVPVGGYQVTATDLQSGDFGRAPGTVAVQDQSVRVNVSLRGQGTLQITVLDGAGAVSPGARVEAHNTDFAVNRVVFAGADGVATFQAFTAGAFTAQARDAVFGLTGSGGGTLPAGGNAALTITLQQAGEIAGKVFSPDGVTPLPGIRVNLSGPQTRQVNSDATGSFRFQGLPLGVYGLAATDSAGNRRATAAGLSIQTQGQAIESNLILSGVGSVVGTVTLADGSVRSGIPVSLNSNAEGAGGTRVGYTDISGQYAIGIVPVGPFSVSVGLRIGNEIQSGAANGTVQTHGEVVTANIALSATFDPNPISLHDANAFNYDLAGDARIGTGAASVFVANGTQRGAKRLEILRDGVATPFLGEAYGPFEESNREVVITEQGVAGLNITRKVYVPADGYFARFLELIENPSGDPITFGVRLTTYYRFIQKTQNGFRFNREPRVVNSSTGDALVGASDRWIEVDDDEDLDPFLASQLPAVHETFGGEGAELPATRVDFELDFVASIGSSVQEWATIVLAPGQKVALLHFVGQQVSRAGGQAAAERLEDLPPEALTGLGAEERSLVKNFSVPENSAVPSLPVLTGAIAGDVLGGDGIVPLPGATVWTRSQNPIFGRTYSTAANALGRYSMAGNPTGNGNAVAIPVGAFDVWARDNFSGITSPTVTGGFGGLVTAEQDIIFGQSGILGGLVKRASGEVVTTGNVTVSGANLLNPLGTSPGADGRYLYRVLPPGLVTVAATLPNPNGTGLSGAVGATVVAGARTEADVVLVGSGSVSGIVRNGSGNPGVSVAVRLSAPGGFFRQVTTGTGGEYGFADVPAGNNYTVTAFEPATGLPSSANVVILEDQNTVQDLTLIGVGSVQVTGHYPNSSPAVGASVFIQESARGPGYRSVGALNALGRLQINGVPVGAFQVKVSHPGNSALFGVTASTMPSHGAVTPVDVTVPVDGPPTVALTNPADGSSFLEGTVITLSANATDDLSVSYVDFLVNGALVGRDHFAPYQANYALPLVNQDTAIVVEAVVKDSGPYLITSASRTVQIRNDTEAPSVSITSPFANQNFREGQSILVQVSAADNLGVASVEFRANGVPFGTDTQSPYAWNYVVPADFGAGSQTPLQFEVVATDVSGLTQTANLTVQITRDDPPSVTLVSPLDGAEVVEGATVGLAASALDDIGVARVDFRVNGVVVASDITSPYTGSFRMPSGGDGEQVLFEAIATDTLGQTATAEARIVRRNDTAAPSVAITSPLNGSTVSIGESDVIIVIDATDLSSLNSGLDVDGDTVLDNVLKAEIHVAKELLRLLNSTSTRVGVVKWNQTGSLRQALNADKSLSETALNDILAEGPAGFFGRNASEGLRVATDELAGTNARRGATPVQLFISYGSFNYPTVEVSRAQDAGVCLNTFAVGTTSSTGNLSSMALATSCSLTTVNSAEQYAALLSRTLLFGINQVPVLATATDAIAVKHVEFHAFSADLSYDQTVTDAAAPFAAQFGVSGLADPLALSLVATAEDFGGNRTESSTVSITVVPASSAPRLTRLNPAIAAIGETILVLGKNFDPVFGNNHVTVSGVSATVLGGNKFQLQVVVPAGVNDGNVVVSTGGQSSNPLFFRVLETGLVRVQVNFNDGAPAPNTAVQYRDENSGVNFINAGNTDAAGRIDILNVSGAFTVRATHPQNSEIIVVQNGTVSSEGQTVQATLTFPGTATVRGRVNFANGDPAGSANVNLQISGFTARNVGTAADGLYEFAGIPVNQFFTLTASHPSGEGLAVTDRITTHGEERTINLTMLTAIRAVDLSGTEGDASTTTFPVSVTLSSPSLLEVRVNYQTSGNSALSGVDFQATSGTLIFAPGETTKDIPVLVNGDLLDEANETFFVSLNSPVNGLLADSSSTVTIQDNDPLPQLSIANVSLAEGNVGHQNMIFTVQLSAASGRSVSVNYATANGTATAPDDYSAISGSLLFNPGETSKTIPVAIIGETTAEESETFFMNLSSAGNAELPNPQATGTIVDDDSAPLVLHHFEFATIPSPQFLDEPFNVVVTAKDSSGLTVTTFDGTVPLLARRPGFVTANFLGTPVHQSSFSSTYTVGFSFTPNTDLTVTHLRHYFGTKFGIWDSAGVPLVLQNIASSPGNWTETPLASPVMLQSGTRYYIGAYSGGGTLYYRSDLFPTTSHGTYHGQYERFGDAFLGSGGGPYDWFHYMVDIGYVVGTLEQIPHTPTSISGFVNGVFTGPVSIHEPHANVVLSVDDGNGHRGESNPFEVGLKNDLAVSVADTPDPADVGGTVTYEITVANSGPADSSNVMLVDTLPADVVFISATPSQGACALNGGSVECSLGDIAGGSSASVTLVVMASTDQALLNQAVASRAEPEAYLLNNSVATATDVRKFFSFRVASLTPNNPRVTTFSTLAGSEPSFVGGIAASGDRVLYTGATRTVSYSLGEMETGAPTPNRLSALVGDLRSGQAYQLADANGLPLAGAGQVTQLLPVDPRTGAPLYGEIIREIWNGAISSPATVPIGNPPVYQDRQRDFDWSDDFSLLGAGSRFRTVIEPTSTGDHVFYVAGDQTELFLSTESEPATRVKIASGADWTGSTEYFNSSTQRSLPQPLIAGTRYILEVVKYVRYNSSVGVAWAPHDSDPNVPVNIPNSVMRRPVSPQLDAEPVVLSAPIALGGGSGLFAGHGCLAIHNGSRVYRIQLPSGKVDDLGSMGMPTHRTANSGFYWGVAENTSDSNTDLVYVRDTTTIVRTRVPSGSTSIVNGFSNLGSMSVITVVPHANRWVFATRTSNQFLGQNTLGSADATFDLVPTSVVNDLSVSVVSSQNPLALDSAATLTIRVANTGPATATAVAVSDVIEGNVNLGSPTASQGSASVNGATVNALLGDIPGGGFAEVTIPVTALSGDSVRHRVSATRGEADLYLPNNSLVCDIATVRPVINISDVLVVEGTGGNSDAIFTVSLSTTRSVPVNVDFSLSGGSATFGVDFLGANGTPNSTVGSLVFAPGEFQKAITVPVVGDALNELDETFSVTLSAPVGARLGDASGAGTIVNDDAPPVINLANVQRAEGNSGMSQLLVPVSLSAPSGLQVRVDYSTADASAVSASPADYLASNGQIVFNPGETAKNIVVNIIGDTTVEPTEVFNVNFANPVNAQLPVVQISATLTDDDGIAGQIHHFVVDGLGSPQYAGEPFSITVHAVDYLNNPVTDYSGTPNIEAYVPSTEVGEVLGNEVHQFNWSSSYTTGIHFTPTVDITVTHIEHYYGQKVTIWGPGGVVLSSQPLVSVPGSWISTALVVPVTLTAGSDYKIGIYSGSSGNRTQYYRDGNYPSNAHLSVNGFLESFGDGYPTSTYQGSHYLVDFRYEVGSRIEIPMTPGALTPFVNGVWTGPVSLFGEAQALQLWIDDGDGHLGNSNAFDVERRNDLLLEGLTAIDPSVGQEISFDWTLSNLGPNSSTGVTLHQVLPYGLVMTSYSISQGTGCSTSPGVDGQTEVDCDLGDLADGDSATVQVYARIHADGIFHSTATVSRTEPEAFTINNSKTLKLRVLGGDEFRILSLATTGSSIVDHNGLTGDDRGGIAVSDSRVFITGDNGTAHYNVLDLSGGASVGRVMEALITDLRSGAIYSLGNGLAELGYGGGMVTSLVRLDGANGNPTGEVILLSSSIEVSYGSMLFSGYGRIVIRDSFGNVWDIEVPSGIVTPVGTVAVDNNSNTESWAAHWGVAEHFDGETYLVYVQNNQTIVRTRVSTGETTTVASFVDLSDMASFTVKPDLSRWYFHHEGGSQFGGASETLGFADAEFETRSTNVSDDLSVRVTRDASTANPGGVATFRIFVANSGPSVATAVQLTSEITGLGAEILSIDSPIGTVDQPDGTHFGVDLGDFAAGATVEIVVNVTVSELGEVVQNATVTRGELDAYFNNNDASAKVVVVQPIEIYVSWSDMTEVAEIGGLSAGAGNRPVGGRIGGAAFGTMATTVEFTLSVPSTEMVEISFSTSDGTAIDGSDYFGQNGTVQFFPGQTYQSITIHGIDDLFIEDSEHFFLNLFSPIGATLAAPDSIQINIFDNDGEIGGESVKPKVASSSAAGVASASRNVAAGSAPQLGIRFLPTTGARSSVRRDTVRMQFESEAGVTYRIEGSSAPTASSVDWQPVESVTGTGRRIELDLPSSGEARFFRLVPVKR